MQSTQYAAPSAGNSNSEQGERDVFQSPTRQMLQNARVLPAHSRRPVPRMRPVPVAGPSQQEQMAGASASQGERFVFSVNYCTHVGVKRH